MITGQYNRLRVHVYASNRKVIRAAHGLLAQTAQRNPAMRAARHKWLRAILQEHLDARRIVQRFRL
jgi:hypothetical protein